MILLSQAQSRSFWKRVHIQSNGCWNWTKAINKKGYGCARFNGKLLRAHRIAYALSHPFIKYDLICHKCDNRKCCRPSHLFSGSHLDNQRDCITKGRSRKAIGEKSSQAKLTRNQVEDIRKMYKTNKYSHMDLSKIFHISKTTIGSIVKNKIWK